MIAVVSFVIITTVHTINLIFLLVQEIKFNLVQIIFYKQFYINITQNF